MLNQVLGDTNHALHLSRGQAMIMRQFGVGCRCGDGFFTTVAQVTLEERQASATGFLPVELLAREDPESQR